MTLLQFGMFDGDLTGTAASAGWVSWGSSGGSSCCQSPPLSVCSLLPGRGSCTGFADTLRGLPPADEVRRTPAEQPRARQEEVGARTAVNALGTVHFRNQGARPRPANGRLPKHVGAGVVSGTTTATSPRSRRR